MTNYLAKFLPKLLEKSSILRELERNGSNWQWLDKHETVWNEIKLLVASTSVRAFYDTKKYVTIQCDASQNGLGATYFKKADLSHMHLEH